jgi:short subunit dehydrogenase-like uncharacterized protein
MGNNILLYGATGYSGRLIAAEAKRRKLGKHDATDCRMILAARDAPALQDVAATNGMDYRVFGLDDTSEIVRRLAGVDVVLNAAGPFAFTAERLAGAAIRARCHYLDINGEIDVYRKLDDLAQKASNQHIALISGAGAWSGMSDALLSMALEKKLKRVKRLGAIRIALSQILDFSRGSAASATRMLREQVLVVRARVAPPPDEVPGEEAAAASEREKILRKMAYVHEPIGKIERIFDFGPLPKNHDRLARGGRNIASAANMIDTLSARHAAAHRNVVAGAIETYVQTGPIGRFAYLFVGMTSSILTCPYARGLTQAQMKLLPEGPTAEERQAGRHVVVLEIEDEFHTRVIDWCFQTPDVYQLTAQIAVAAARNMARSGFTERGWLTPAEGLGLTKIEGADAFEGCKFLRGGGV